MSSFVTLTRMPLVSGCLRDRWRPCVGTSTQPHACEPASLLLQGQMHPGYQPSSNQHMLYQQQVNPQMAPGWGRARSAGRGRGRLLPNWHQGGLGPGASPLMPMYVIVLAALDTVVRAARHQSCVPAPVQPCGVLRCRLKAGVVRFHVVYLAQAATALVRAPHRPFRISTETSNMYHNWMQSASSPLDIWRRPLCADTLSRYARPGAPSKRFLMKRVLQSKKAWEPSSWPGEQASLRDTAAPTCAGFLVMQVTPSPSQELWPWTWRLALQCSPLGGAHTKLEQLFLIVAGVFKSLGTVLTTDTREQSNRNVQPRRRARLRSSAGAVTSTGTSLSSTQRRSRHHRVPGSAKYRGPPPRPHLSPFQY